MVAHLVARSYARSRNGHQEAKTMQKPIVVERAPIAKAKMLIRRPVHEVFSAFTEPEQITSFWLWKTSGRLTAGARVHWEFIVRGAATDVVVEELRADQRIVIKWSEGEIVRFDFAERGPAESVVTVENSGFSGSGDEVVEKALVSTSGFTIVLCELKAFLERGIQMKYGPHTLFDAELNVPR
jgi:uncharacterized protein YndB with AHSA1/START domain